jgi:hypothetical protein
VISKQGGGADPEQAQKRKEKEEERLLEVVEMCEGDGASGRCRAAGHTSMARPT